MPKADQEIPETTKKSVELKKTSITIKEDLRKFALEDAEERGIRSLSAYVDWLIRREKKRQASLSEKD